MRNTIITLLVGLAGAIATQMIDSGKIHYAGGIAGLALIIVMIIETIKTMKKYPPAQKAEISLKMNMSQHPVFYSLDILKKNVIEELLVTHIEKRKACSLMLKIYVSVHRDGLQEFLKKNDAETVVKTIFEFMCDLKMKCNVMITQTKLPKNLRLNVCGMLNEDFKLIVKRLAEIADSKFYNNAETAATAQLDIINYYLHTIILNAENVLNTMNGKLEAALEATPTQYSDIEYTGEYNWRLVV
ncbi:MAG TPA: hypothetical protein PLM72_10835 [Spirochaetota bacterium]|nr:hypothetical protein [Spirochaetota bacterium]